MRYRRHLPSLFLILVFLLSACGNDLLTPPPATVTAMSTSEVQLTPIDLPVGYGVRGPWFELYFTDPDGLAIQLQDTKYCGGGGYLGDVCPG